MKVFREVLLALVTVAAVTWLAWEKAGPTELFAQQPCVTTRDGKCVAYAPLPFSVYESGDFCVYVIGATQPAIAVASRRNTRSGSPLRCQ